MPASQREAPQDLATILDEIPDDATRAIEEIAARISREFGAVLSPEDLAGEVWVYIAERPQTAKHWFFVGDDGEERFGWKSFRRDIAGIMAKAARREKAIVFGFDEDDQVFYGKAQVADLLMYVWHDSDSIATPGPEVRTSASVDPAKGGGMAVAIADIRAAYKKVIHKGSQWDQVLTWIYQYGASQVETARLTKLDRTTVNRTHSRALEALLQELNGTLPIKDDGPGTRTVISNSAALYLTRSQEES